MYPQPTPIQPVFQHPTDLVLAVAVLPVAAGLTVLRQQVVQHGAWRFTLAIIGESHVVSVARDGVCVLQEVLACVDLPPSRCRHYHRFTRLTAHDYRQAGYRARVAFDDIPTRASPDHPTLALRFPMIYGHAPLTRVQWSVDGPVLRWWTLHTYPHPTGLTCVHTASTIDLTELQEGR